MENRCEQRKRERNPPVHFSILIVQCRKLHFNLIFILKNELRQSPKALKVLFQIEDTSPLSATACSIHTNEWKSKS